MIRWTIAPDAVYNTFYFIANHSFLVPSHSIGGVLATLITADVAKHALCLILNPANLCWTFSEKKKKKNITGVPLCPKDVHLYSFGSQRVRNLAFVTKFENLVGSGLIKEAYHVVNGESMVA